MSCTKWRPFPRRALHIFWLVALAANVSTSELSAQGEALSEDVPQLLKVFLASLQILHHQNQKKPKASAFGFFVHNFSIPDGIYFLTAQPPPGEQLASGVTVVP